MTDISALNAANGFKPEQSDTARKSLSNNFDTFLTLLTTQLANQDPLNPQDSSEFTNQLVQFSQVEQQINTNKNLEKVVDSQALTATQAALGYIGLDIRSEGTSFTHQEGKSSLLSYRLDKEAGDAKLAILDKNGTQIFSTTTAATSGEHGFEWDGTLADGSKAPAGSYQIRVGVTAKNGETAPKVTTIVPGKVDGIVTDNGTVMLTIGNRLVDLGEVRSASLPN